MMRRFRTPCAAVLVLAAVCVAGGATHARAGDVPVVDVFPAQSWASLGAEPVRADAPPPVEAPAPVPVPPSLDDPIEAPPEVVAPFDIAGEWRERGQRIVVLDGPGGPYLLCGSRCDVRGAVLPGGEIADGYRLKQLDEQGTVIVTRGSTDIALPLPVPTR